jgi:hypothetical protein
MALQRDRWLVRLLAFAGGLIAFASLLGGCYRKMSISMERIGAQYVLHFKASGQDAAVRALFVSTLEEGKATGNVCEWGAQLPLHPVVGKWIYGGSLPAEYESKGCRPLTAGLYRVQALGFGGGGILNVRLDQAGNVQPL